ISAAWMDRLDAGLRVWQCRAAVRRDRRQDLPRARARSHLRGNARPCHTLRVLGVAYKLGHVVKGEGDQVIPLLGRLIAHARTTAKYGVFYGEGRDIYDVRGRTAHEAIFNVANGAFRCVGTQQGYSGFSTWTRGLSWAMCG